MDDADITEARAALADKLRGDAAPFANKSVPRLKPTGSCHHCGEATTPTQLFCGAACARVFKG